MMSEDLVENGRINDQGEEEISPVATPDINSPRQSVCSPLVSPDEPGLEFFQQKGSRAESGSEGGSSPMLQDKEDTVSHNSRSYVTVSPSVSPGPSDGAAAGQDVGEQEAVKPQPVPRTKIPHSVLLKEEGMEGEGVRSPLGQDIDLKIEITEREKVAVKSDSYISYKICTRSSRPFEQFDQDRYEVWRRYRDFEWLREVLEKQNFTLIVPPLPGKQLTRYFDQKSEQFLDERQKALDKFLKRLATHPYFSFSKHLKTFITANSSDFAAYIAETSSSNRLLGAMASSVKMAANSFRLKNPDPEYAKEAKYFEGLGEKLGIVERVATRLHTERAELASNMEELSSDIMKWGMNEPQLVDPIRGMGTCMENCTSALQTLNDDNAYSLMMTAREYQLYCASGVSAVRRRDGLQLDHERAAEEREKRKKIHDDAANAGKLQKLPKLAEDLQKAGVEAERTLDDLSVANEQLRVDVEKWREAKDKEISHLMTTFAGNHVNYHTKCFEEWGKVLALLRDPKLAARSTGSSSDESFSVLGDANGSANGSVDTEAPYSQDLFS